VGGAVRDAYRGHPFKDVDLVTAQHSLRLARHLADKLNGAYYALDKTRGIGRVLLTYQGEDIVIDVSLMAEGDLLADLQARDFTINALAVDLTGDLAAIVDPLGGVADWNAKILRRCSESAIADDPIRALRAVRQALAFGLSLDPATRTDVKQVGPRLTLNSPERLRDEFFRLLGGKKPISGLGLLQTLGLLAYLFPELAPDIASAWRKAQAPLEKTYTLLSVISPLRDDNIAANAAFGTLVYLLDRFRPTWSGRIMTSYVEGRTHFSLVLFMAFWRYMLPDAPDAPQAAYLSSVHFRLTRHESETVEAALSGVEVVHRLLAEGEPTPRHAYRFWVALGEAGWDAVCLALVDTLEANGFNLTVPAWTAYLGQVRALLEGHALAQTASSLLNGDELMAHFRLAPGKQVGELLSALREANALGEIHTREEALAWAGAWLENPPA
jgi:tRNA nucleotidyltransferase/poly(A) polymerase